MRALAVVVFALLALLFCVIGISLTIFAVGKEGLTMASAFYLTIYCSTLVAFLHSKKE